jgi:uncharacterized protein (TIGR02265 family)
VPLDRTEKEARQRECRLDDRVRAVIFQGVLKAVGEHCGDDVVRACAALVESRLEDGQPWLPASDFLDLLWAATFAIEPKCGGTRAALHALGRSSVRVAVDHRLGRAALPLLSRAPRAFVNFFPGIYRVVTSYGNRSVVWEAPKRAILTFKRDLVPVGYHEGTMAEGLAYLGLTGIEVVGEATGPFDAEYRLSWA